MDFKVYEITSAKGAFERQQVENIERACFVACALSKYYGEVRVACNSFGVAVYNNGAKVEEKRRGRHARRLASRRA